MNTLTVVLSALGATGMELAEAAIVVLVVIGLGQRRAALIGAACAATAVVALAIALGPHVIGLVPLDRLRQILGAGLLAIGGYWLLHAILRPDAASHELRQESQAAFRWAQRGAVGAGLVSAKAVGVEGAEAAVLVVAIGGPRHALVAAALGASLAALAVIGFAIRLERGLTSLASYTLNRVAGTALSLVGGYWLADGSHLAPSTTTSRSSTPRCGTTRAPLATSRAEGAAHRSRGAEHRRPSDVIRSANRRWPPPVLP